MGFKFDTIAQATLPSDEGTYKRRRKWAPSQDLPPDRALILVAHGIGLILEHSGEGLDYWICEGVGADGFCESLGDLPEEGLWVFEGNLLGVTHESYDYGTEYDCEVDGEYRRMTEEELEVWVEDHGTIVALWEQERDVILDQWPCERCGHPLTQHTKTRTPRSRIAIVHPQGRHMSLFYDEEVRFCPEGGEVPPTGA